MSAGHSDVVDGDGRSYTKTSLKCRRSIVARFVSIACISAARNCHLAHHDVLFPSYITLTSGKFYFVVKLWKIMRRFLLFIKTTEHILSIKYIGFWVEIFHLKLWKMHFAIRLPICRLAFLFLFQINKIFHEMRSRK